MKKTKIIYWIFTSLFAFMMLGSAIPDIFSVQIAVDGFKKIGYPVYLLPFLGIAKTAGVIAILVPGYARLKEWAYAGLVFDLLGATYSIIASGEPVGSWIGMILPLALAAGSYIYYHKKLKLSAAGTTQHATGHYYGKAA
jgi:DoxX-like protein